MRSEKRLRDELRFVAEFYTLFDVTQQAAMSQLRRLEERLADEAPILEALTREWFPLLPADAWQHPLVRPREGGRLLVVLTSDEGLVGSLHSAVIRRAVARAEGASAEWVFVGQRGPRLLGVPAKVLRVLPIPSDAQADEEMRRLSQSLLQHYQRVALQEAWLVAPRFISATRQEVVEYPLLPLPIGPAMTARESDLVIEPSVDRVVNGLASWWVEATCVEAFWSARRAECAARALHVEASRQELGRRTRTLRHEFFKTLHERLDVLVRETCVVQRHAARRLLATRIPSEVM